jgi:ABC-type amino acid transport substrate-binding protein
VDCNSGIAPLKSQKSWKIEGDAAMNKNKVYQMGMFSILAMLVVALLAACQSATPVPPTPTPVVAQSATNSGIVIAVDSGNAPFMYEKSGQAAGLYPDLLQEAFKRMGIAASIKAYPWKRALVLGERGEAGIGGIYKTDARVKIYDYSAPLFSEKILIYVKKGSGFEFNTVNDLKGKTLGFYLDGAMVIASIKPRLKGYSKPKKLRMILSISRS